MQTHIKRTNQLTQGVIKFVPDHCHINNPFVRPSEMTFSPPKNRKIMLCHNAQRNLGQSEDIIFCVMLYTHMQILHNILSHIFLGTHFINMLIVVQGLFRKIINWRVRPSKELYPLYTEH